jgi:hypothetical protein
VRPARKGQGGAAIVELAICVMLLVTLTFGAIEFGWAWKQRISLQSITRSAARVASGLGDDPYTDREVIRGILTSAAKLPGGVARVGSIVIYKATCSACTDPYSQPSQVDPNCDLVSGTPPTGGVNGKCNVYFPSTGYFTSTVINTNANWGSAASSSLDKRWTPTTRITSTNGTGPDYVGIRVNYTHRMIVGLFGTTIAMSDESVFRLEPA